MPPCAIETPPAVDDDVVDAAVVFGNGEVKRQAAVRPDLGVTQRLVLSLNFLPRNR